MPRRGPFPARRSFTHDTWQAPSTTRKPVALQATGSSAISSSSMLGTCGKLPAAGRLGYSAATGGGAGSESGGVVWLSSTVGAVVVGSGITGVASVTGFTGSLERG